MDNFFYSKHYRILYYKNLYHFCVQYTPIGVYWQFYKVYEWVKIQGSGVLEKREGNIKRCEEKLFVKRVSWCEEEGWQGGRMIKRNHWEEVGWAVYRTLRRTFVWIGAYWEIPLLRFRWEVGWPGRIFEVVCLHFEGGKRSCCWDMWARDFDG